MNKNNPRIAIVDYQISNLFSVQRACEIAGMTGLITNDPDVIMASDGIILPGVGAFADAMNNLRNLGLIKILYYAAESGKPFMGICLGLQLLFEQSSEFGVSEGMGLLEGKVIPIPHFENGRKRKVPHIAWNRVDILKNHSVLKGLSQGVFMYFVHSFVVRPDNIADIMTITDYEGFSFCSSIASGNIVAFQFHPEKSSEKGLQIYKNFKDIVEG